MCTYILEYIFAYSLKCMAISMSVNNNVTNGYMFIHIHIFMCLWTITSNKCLDMYKDRWKWTQTQCRVNKDEMKHSNKRNTKFPLVLRLFNLRNNTPIKYSRQIVCSCEFMCMCARASVLVCVCVCFYLSLCILTSIYFILYMRAYISVYAMCSHVNWYHINMSLCFVTHSYGKLSFLFHKPLTIYSPQSVYRRTCHPNFFSGAFPLGVARSLYDQSAIRYLLCQHLSYITICLAGPPRVSQ